MAEGSRLSRAYAALDEEFALARALIEARTVADCRKDEIAKRMRTSQPTIARLEGGAWESPHSIHFADTPKRPEHA